MQKTLFITAAISGALAVGLGAFAAHGLKGFLEKNEMLNTFETAVRYHFYHTFALLAVALLFLKVQDKLLYYSGNLFILGIILFSGSLYLMCFTGIKKIGIITPFGGLAFITGWLILAWVMSKSEVLV